MVNLIRLKQFFNGFGKLEIDFVTVSHCQVLQHFGGNPKNAPMARERLDAHYTLNGGTP